MLIKHFYLKDIKKYEDETGNNILNFFNDIRFSYIIDLVRLGNNYCSEEQACNILDEYLESESNSIVSAVLEIKESLIGIGDNNDNDVDDNDKIDITSYNSLTDLYTQFGMELMSVGLSYSEFWDMNTKEMYRVFNSICIKIQNETNRELSNYHTLAAMVGGAVWGKLQKDAPKVDMRPINKDKDVDDDIAILNAKLKAFAATHNKSIEKGE